MHLTVKPIRIALKLAFSSIRAYGSRSIVIVFSIALGITSVLMTRGILRGMDKEQENTMNRNGGITTIWLDREKPHGAKEKMLFGRSPGILPEQIDWACKNIPGIAFSVPRIVGHADISYGNASYEKRFVAVNHHYAPTYIRESLAEGKFFSEKEYEEGAKVCMMGQIFRERFFGESGSWEKKKISINGVLFEVIAIINGDYEWSLFLPLTAYWTNFGMKRSPLPKCEFMCTDTSAILSVQKALDDYLFMAHRGIRDYTLDNALNLRKELIANQKLSRIITIGMGLLALVLAVIGIVNVFLAILNERIREIGMYKSLGSSNTDIFLQYFLESILLALLGGCIGIVAGSFLLNLPFLPWKGVLKLSDYFLTIGAAMLAGVASGLLPAIVASRFSPAKAIGHFS